MALTPSISRTSVAEDGSYSVLTDGTTYGGANPDRNEVAVFLTAYRVDEDLVETAVDITAFDPKTATDFTVTNDVDGRYKYNFIIADDWLIGTEYNQYDVVWSPTEEAFYEYTFETPTTGNVVTDTIYWTALPDPTTKIDDVGTAEESGNLLYQVYERILDYATAACYANVAILAAKESCADDCNPVNSKYARPRNRLRTLLSVMRISDTRQQYLQGEKFAREAQKYCDECGCLEQ